MAKKAKVKGRWFAEGNALVVMRSGRTIGGAVDVPAKKIISIVW